MMTIRFVIILSSVLFTGSSYAINWQKCRQVGPGSAGALTSSTQFTSSWGPCSIFANTTEGRKKLFLANNLDLIQIDSSRGSGEYLASYAKLSGCSELASQKLGSTLKSNYTQIFGIEVEHSPKQAYERIENLLSSDSELSVGCKPKS